MKVVCVKNYKKDLTIDKEYEILYSLTDYYMMRDDNSKIIMCDKEYFLTMKEYRNRRLEEIGI